MKMLISKTELDSKGSRELIPLECYQCNKTHYRTKNVILRILNGNHQNTLKGCFCSKQCKYENMKTYKVYECKNCGNSVKRVISSIRGKNIFCSSSCSAKFNNSLRILNKSKYNKPIMLRKSDKTEKIKKCKFCETEFKLNKKFQLYCSSDCKSKEHRQEIWKKIENGETHGHSVRTIKQYLIYKRGNKCEMCGITEWGGKPLITIMDHINGNNQDSSLSNLRLICSNCDTLTPTYKSKNRGNGRYYRKLRYNQGMSY